MDRKVCVKFIPRYVTSIAEVVDILWNNEGSIAKKTISHKSQILRGA